MPLVKCKVHLGLNWTKNCVMSDKLMVLKHLKYWWYYMQLNERFKGLFIGVSTRQR